MSILVSTIFILVYSSKLSCPEIAICEFLHVMKLVRIVNCLISAELISAKRGILRECEIYECGYACCGYRRSNRWLLDICFFIEKYFNPGFGSSVSRKKIFRNLKQSIWTQWKWRTNLMTVMMACKRCTKIRARTCCFCSFPMIEILVYLFI